MDPRAAGHSKISQRAYEIFEARGRHHGHDLDDWLQAERELNRTRAIQRRSNPPEEYVLQAGNPERWQQFAKSHHQFLLRMPKLVELSNRTFNREWATAEPLDRIVFTFGVMCWEDFEELLLLGANGYGFGCLKILRGMYERLVTASYLHRNPGETERFLDFHYIADYKVARELFGAFGEDELPADALQDKKKLRDSVKDKFMRACPTKGCDKQIPAFSWTNMDFVSMAKSDKGLGRLVGFSYYIPMTETHPSVRAMMSRMAEGESGVTLAQRTEKAATWASSAVCNAHNLTLQNLFLQQEHFKELKEFEPLLEGCLADFQASWGEAREDANAEKQRSQ
jgi:DUF2934 family protein/uncharacterized protein DUF5677